jgi:hypothetical protein
MLGNMDALLPWMPAYAGTNGNGGLSAEIHPRTHLATPRCWVGGSDGAQNGGGIGGIGGIGGGAGSGA